MVVLPAECFCIGSIQPNFSLRLVFCSGSLKLFSKDRICSFDFCPVPSPLSWQSGQKPDMVEAFRHFAGVVCHTNIHIQNRKPFSMATDANMMMEALITITARNCMMMDILIIMAFLVTIIMALNLAI
jgi:hypothetical protein